MSFRRRTFWLLVLLLLTSLPVMGYAQTTEDATAECDTTLTAGDYIQRGLDAYNAEDYETAIAETLCAQALDPENPIVYNNIAYYQSRLGLNDEALVNYAEALRLDPDYTSALVNRGDLLLDLEQYADAIVDYDAAIELEPTGYKHNRRGIAYFNLGDLGAAEADFDAAFQLEPDEAIYVRNRAAARFNLERYDEAAADFATAGELAPDWDIPAFGVGDAYYSGRRYDEAAEAYRAAIVRFGSRDWVDPRMREIAVLRSNLLAEDFTPAPSGAITAESIAALTSLGRSEDSHRGSILSVVYSLDGSHLVSSDENGLIVLWDAEDQELSRIKVEGRAEGLAFAPDGAHLAAIIDDRSVIIIDVLSFSITGQIEADETGSVSLIGGVAYSPDSALIAVGWDDGSIHIYDAPTQMPVGVFTPQGDAADLRSSDGVSPVAFSPDGRIVAGVTGSTLVRLWDVVEGTEITSLQGADDPINTLVFDSAGARLFAGTDEGLYVWESETGEFAVPPVETPARIVDLRFSPDDKLLAASGVNVHIFDAETVEQVAELSGDFASLAAAVFSPDGSRLLAGRLAAPSMNNALVIYEVFTTALSLDLAAYSPITPENIESLDLVAEMDTPAARGLVWSPDGTALMANSENGIYRFSVDGSVGTVINLPFGEFAIHQGMPLFLARLTGADGNRIVNIYDVADFETPLLSYDYGEAPMSNFIYNGDSLIASLSSTDTAGTRSLELVRLPLDGSEPQVITPLESFLFNIAVRGDGVMTFASPQRVGEDLRLPSLPMFSSDGTPYVEIANPFPATNLTGEIILMPAQSIAFSPDGTLLAAAAGNFIRLWEETTPRQWAVVDNLAMEQGLGSLQFSPLGTWLISRSSGGVAFYHVIRGDGRTRLQEVKRMEIESSSSTGSIRFNHDETLIAINTGNDTVQIWGVGE